MALRLPELGTFERRLRPVRVDVSSLIRLSRSPATEPYWSTGVYRFDDPQPQREGSFGVCYAGNSIAVAFAESVIHEVGRFIDGRYEVPVTELTERWIVRFRRERRKTLVLADLTGEGLKAIGLNNDISATNDYTVPQHWAQAIHGASPRWDGVRYVSRQMNKGARTSRPNVCCTLNRTHPTGHKRSSTLMPDGRQAAAHEAVRTRLATSRSVSASFKSSPRT